MANSNVVPIVDPDRGFKMWHIDEIFTGQAGMTEDDKRYVPNERDLVFSATEGFFVVEEVDYTTGLSVLKPWDEVRETGFGENDRDLLLGQGPGKISESYRVYLDTSVTPHTLAFDARLKVYGTTTKYVKVFKGTRIENGDVISRQYDQNGSLLGEDIPLEMARTEDASNLAIKAPQVGYSAKAMEDGEIVTAVFYDDAGDVVSISHLLVKNTSFIRTMNESTKYITSIEIESPFLSKSDNRVLECPINIPIEAIARMGIVKYSNGEEARMPIDGTKFDLYGLRRFVSTILGQRQPITLTYRLSPNEVAYGSVPGATNHITEDYLATTTKVDGAYSVKLFSYPTWVDETSGYRLEHFLYNLERDEVFNVTQYVELAANSKAFEPKEYGVAQDITFAVDLSKVSNRFKNYRHLQTTRIVLRRPGLDTNTTNWTVQFDRGEEAYGEGLKAELEFVNSNLWNLRVDNDFGSMEHWLREVYEKTLPLYDKTSEDKPPTPTHFRLIAGNYSNEWPVSMWNEVFTLNTIQEAGENVYLQFFRRTSQTDLELSTAGLIIRQIN
ncbi:MAG: hypothetical protein CL582_11755 [Alteromonadaceae bacterium]|nr:hypothetical protein [Alteromonadaceae bacterium]|tara:strand:- start:1434 stop:3101 length:1668 start_codon:yes stop_codon:yes gene_type:complete